MHSPKSILSVSVLLLINIFFIIPGRGQNLFDYQHTTIFADHLFDAAEYKMAVIEYKRLATFSTLDDSLTQKIMLCYRLGGMADSAMAFYQKKQNRNNNLSESLKLEIIKNTIITRQFGVADSLLNTNGFADSLVNQRYKFYCAILNYHWETAQNIYETRSYLLNDNKKAWEKLLKKQESLKNKSPVAAMLMSVIIPGSGKIYANDWKDGLVSMFIIGSLGFESYEGFHTKGYRSVLGYVFGAMTIGYYGGNIYGSYQSAVRYNMRSKIEIHDAAEKMVISGF